MEKFVIWKPRKPQDSHVTQHFYFLVTSREKKKKKTRVISPTTAYVKIKSYLDPRQLKTSLLWKFIVFIDLKMKKKKLKN